MTTRSPIKPLQSILIKPAGPDCNIDCTYCFYLEKASLFPETQRHRMSLEVLEEMIKQAMENGGRFVNFGWQGGEPTLMGLDFFRQAVAFQRQYGQPGQTVGNGLQTNGTLLDEEWAEFLRENHFLVGLSIDGPQHVHDHYRVTKGGRPTWETVYKNGLMLLRNKVEVNALTVLSDYSSQFPEEIYTFHKEMGLEHMQFIPCVEADPEHPERAAQFSLSPEAYGEFLCKLFDLWMQDFKHDRPTTSIRYFDSVFHTYVGLAAPECTLLEECGCYVAVEHNGNVYACDFFVEDEWKLGNLMCDDLLEMLNTPRQKEFGLVKKDLPTECVTCDYLKHCWGGCPKDRLRNAQTRGSNQFCKSFLMFFDHAHDRLKRLAERWQRQQIEEQARATRQQHKKTRR